MEKDSFPWLLYHWGPPVLSTPLLLAPFVALAYVAPDLLAHSLGFVVSLSVVCVVINVILALITKRLGWYQLQTDPTKQRVPRRLGATPNQLAVIAAWFVFPQQGIVQPWWLYVVTFVVVGMVGVIVCDALVGKLFDESTSDSDVQEPPSTNSLQASSAQLSDQDAAVERIQDAAPAVSPQPTMHTQRGTWLWFWQSWLPGVMCAPIVLLAFVATIVIEPLWLSTPMGFLLTLGSTAFVVDLVLAIVRRWWRHVWAEPWEVRIFEAAPQGIAANQLAVVGAGVLLPHLGITQPWWVYAIAFVIFGLIGRWVFSIVVDTAELSVKPVAPAWTQQVATLFLAFSGISFVRLMLQGTPHFLWGGMALLLIGLILPQLVVMCGGGRTAER
ncbi:MAG: hypothetical protein GFH27_549279n341 [Chloroflexi bacterium AL-W]|nr:hypothetical protein [Chloroflexi bacterium AL-N1]NOK65307.1 hypothetical protein [Chloroflexi bacterium AL-N10]NOK72428.1 hypothetical protein [Chloroflexi bacterium AL-N5]NOK79486.1 hypothetical protein [Chloroflexi bacterium AL-W]NOK87402.1 hypothetical protein [Chloroflexi bacterium AL-N15]